MTFNIYEHNQVERVLKNQYDKLQVKLYGSEDETKFFDLPIEIVSQLSELLTVPRFAAITIRMNDVLCEEDEEDRNVFVCLIPNVDQNEVEEKGIIYGRLDSSIYFYFNGIQELFNYDGEGFEIISIDQIYSL